MITWDTEGNYIKIGTLNDKVFIEECLADWRPKTYTEEEIITSLEFSQTFNTTLFESSLFEFPSVVFIFCTANDEPVAAIKSGFRTLNKIIAFDIEYVVVHPSHRSFGYFSKFYRMISWFMNQHLKIDISYFEVLKDVPQVVGATTKLNKEIHYEGMTQNNLIQKFGAIFTYNSFKEGLLNIANTQIYSTNIPEITYEVRARTADRHKVKPFNLTWSINGDMQILRK